MAARARLELYEERERIARDLHDVIVQRLYAAGMHLDLLVRRPDRKLARKDWRFELFYWDYTIGVLLLTLVLGLTLGSSGSEGRPFAADLSQASHASIHSALLGGAIFNLANILLVAAIDVAWAEAAGVAVHEDAPASTSPAEVAPAATP